MNARKPLEQRSRDIAGTADQYPASASMGFAVGGQVKSRQSVTDCDQYPMLKACSMPPPSGACDVMYRTPS